MDTETELKQKIGMIFDKELPGEFNNVINDEFLMSPKYLCDGEFRNPSDSSQANSQVYSCTEASGLGASSKILLGECPQLSEAEALDALEAAIRAYDKGFGEWPRLESASRIEAISEFAERMKSYRKKVARLECLEIGKPLKDCYKEFDRTVEYIQKTAEAMGKRRWPFTGGGLEGSVDDAPYGVGLCMGPYNYPLNETYTILIPAIAMGNTVVVKGPKIGMLCQRPLEEVFKEIFPKGVVNFINGDGKTIVTPLIKSGKLDIFSFIGSSKVCKTILSNHPELYKVKVNAGLEAKNPAIITADADLDRTAQECVEGALTFNGQRCTALKMLYAHKDIADKFATKIAEAVAKLTFGQPWEDVMLTPLADPKLPEYLKGLVDDALMKGAKVINPAGGTINKNFFYPAVLYPVTPDMRVAQEEQFGPVVPISVYTDFREVARAMASSKYGQQASVFSESTKKLEPIVQMLINIVCRININTQCQRGPDNVPFTGRKDSAIGTLSINDALNEFSKPIVIARKMMK